MRITPGIAIALALAAWSLRPAAQTNTGEVFGKVVDADGGAMPGVSVTLFGSALKAPIVANTDRRGVFRSDVPPGTFNAWFVMTGFLPIMTERVVGVRIATTAGDIDLAIDDSRAPMTTTNFLKYVDAGFYTGGRFYRVTRPDNYTPLLPNRPPMEIIQGGSNPAKNDEKFPPIPLERTSVTGLKHVAGTVSMARGAPDSATTEFFVLFDDQPSLDFGGKRFADEQGGAAFGRVLAGLDVARKIQQGPVQGQNLVTPVQILRITRLR